MELNRQTVAAFQKDLDAAVAPLLAKYGFKSKANKGRFDSFSLRVSLEFVVAGEEQTQAAAMHNSYLSQRFGLKVGDKVIRLDDSKEYTITGATARSEKYPLTGKTANGKDWRISHRGLKKADGSPVVDAWAHPAPAKVA